MREQFKVGDRVSFHDRGGFCEGHLHNKKVIRNGIIMDCREEVMGGWQGKNKKENIYGIKVDFLGGNGYLGVPEEHIICSL